MKEKLKSKEVLRVLVIGIIYCIGLIVYAWYSSVNAPADLKGFQFELPLLLGGVFLISGSIFVILMIYVIKPEIQKIYLGMALVIFSLFLWTHPPVHGHDIQFHYDSTYVLSNRILNQRSEIQKIGENSLAGYLKRECDQFIQYSHFANYLASYADMQREMFRNIKAENTQLVEADTFQGEISVPLYFYFPQAFGFAMARLLGLNMFWLMFLGRICICIACIALTYRSIKNTPFGKEIFLLCGLIPTTMLTYANVSRDALILAVSFYFTAKCLQLVYCEEKKRWWDYGLLFLSLMLLVPCKLVYIPFAILLNLFVCKYYKKGIWNRNYLFIACAVLAVLAGLFISINFKYLKIYIMGTNAYSMGEDSPFTLPYIFANPGQTVAVVVRTLLTSLVRYYANMIAIGDYGGGIHKEMVVVDSLFMVALVILTNRPNGNDQHKILKTERLIMALTWLGVSGMIVFAFLLCTPHTNDVIIGVQGRYFTPALPLIILSFCYIGKARTSQNKLWIGLTDYLAKPSVKRGILLGIYGLSVFVVVNMYVFVVTYVTP